MDGLQFLLPLSIGYQIFQFDGWFVGPVLVLLAPQRFSTNVIGKHYGIFEQFKTGSCCDRCGWPNYWFIVLLFVHLRVADCSDQPIIFCFAVAYYISFSLFRVTTLTAVINWSCYACRSQITSVCPPFFQSDCILWIFRSIMSSYLERSSAFLPPQLTIHLFMAQLVYHSLDAVFITWCMYLMKFSYLMCYLLVMNLMSARNECAYPVVSAPDNLKMWQSSFSLRGLFHRMQLSFMILGVSCLNFN